MGEIRDLFIDEKEKRARRLHTQRMLLAPGGEFGFIHKECIDTILLTIEQNDLIVLPDQIEELIVTEVLEKCRVDSIGPCDSCGEEIEVRHKSYYRIWVAKKAHIEQVKELREKYKIKNEEKLRKQVRHEKWQAIEYKTPYKFLPFIRFVRKWCYRLLKT